MFGTAFRFFFNASLKGIPHGAQAVLFVGSKAEAMSRDGMAPSWLQVGFPTKKHWEDESFEKTAAT